MKKENLEKIYHLAQEAGLSSDEVAEYLSAKENSCIALNVTPAQILPGMFVYAGGMICSQLLPKRKVMAVVGYVEEETLYAVCLKQNKLPWSSEPLRVWRTQDLTDGREATRKILEVSRKMKGIAEAAEWCFNYTEDGVKKGEAFLPSLAELKKLYLHIDAVNAAFDALGIPSLRGIFLSSTEAEYHHVRIFNMITGNRDNSSKNRACAVLPMFKVEL